MPRTRHALPDARIVVEPTITAQSIHSTPNATANATLHLIAAALTADRRRVHGQVRLAGEALCIDGVCGFPIAIGREGWRLSDIECLDDVGRTAVVNSAAAISSFVSGAVADTSTTPPFATRPNGGHHEMAPLQETLGSRPLQNTAAE
jgi:malate dehydrogenase